MTLALVGRVGMDLASLRYLAAYRASDRWALFRGFVGYSRKAVATTASGIAFVAAAAVLASNSSFARSAFVVVTGAALIPILAMQETVAAQLRSQKIIISSQAPRYLIIPLSILTGAVLIVGVGSIDLDATSTLGIAVVIHLLGLVYLWIRFASVVPESVSTVTPELNRTPWLRAGLVMAVVGVFQLINVRTDVLMLGIMNGMKDAGIYVAASQTAALTGLGLAGFGAIAAPVFSELHATSKKTELQRTLKVAARGLAVYTIPVAIFSIAFGKPILAIFGPDFPSGYEAMVVLVLGHTASVLAGPVGFLAIMTGHQNWAASILGATALANIALNAALIPIYGMTGAAIATTLCKIVCNLGLLVFVYRKLDLNPTLLQRNDAS